MDSCFKALFCTLSTLQAEGGLLRPSYSPARRLGARVAMGNFLDTPITEKKTEIGADGKLQYGLSAMQGWRAQMEDDHVQLLSLPGVIPALGIARL